MKKSRHYSPKEVAAIKMNDRKVVKNARHDLRDLSEATNETRKILHEGEKEMKEIKKVKKEKC